jgi:hypothetical protein
MTTTIFARELEGALLHGDVVLIHDGNHYPVLGCTRMGRAPYISILLDNSLMLCRAEATLCVIIKAVTE